MLWWLAACAHPVATPPPPPLPPKAHAIYFILVDRFFDGDPSNNADANLADPEAFHGGDLAGVIQKLDYIQGLGFDTVWLSPIWKMRTTPFFGHGAFHGYWVTDPAQLEPRFGTEADLQALSAGLHQRGMRLLLDMVYNHVSFDAPLRSEKPDWFHPSLPIVNWNDPTEVLTHEVHGLPDLDQENPEVFAWMQAWTQKWLQVAQPDGFRIDAVRHIPIDFLARLSQEIHATLPDFYLLGEFFDGDPVKVAETREQAGLSSVFDFPLHYAMIDVFCKDQPPGRIASTLSLDHIYGKAEHLVPFLDNHDVSRLRSACGGEDHRVIRALQFLLTLRGTPALSYGTETGLMGAKEPENRASMDFSAPALFTSVIQEGLKHRGPLWEKGQSQTLSLGSDFWVLLRQCGPAEGCLQEEAGVMVWSQKAADVALPKEIQGWNAEIGPSPQTGLLHFEAPGLAIGRIQPLPRATAPIDLRLQVEGEGEMVLAGAGPQLGNWDPNKAPAFIDGQLHLSLNPGEVLACKLVKKTAAGQFQWESGKDRYFLAGSDIPPLHFDIP